MNIQSYTHAHTDSVPLTHIQHTPPLSLTHTHKSDLKIPNTADGGPGGHLEHYEEEHPGGPEPRGEARQYVFFFPSVYYLHGFEGEG